MFFAMTTQAARVDILSRHRFKTDDFANVASALYMRGAGTVAGLAAVTVLESSFEVWSLFELILVEIFMTCFAGIAAYILCCLALLSSDRLCLVIGSEG